MNRKLSSLLVATSMLLTGTITSRAESTPTESDYIDGLSVYSIWDVANFVDQEWLDRAPVFSKHEDGYVGSATLAAKKPETGEPLGLNMTWFITRVEGARAVAERHLTLPEQARFLVEGAFDYKGTRVVTYSAVIVRNGVLTSEHIGYVDSHGEILPMVPTAGNSIAHTVFSLLNIRGPFVREIIVLPEEEG